MLETQTMNLDFIRTFVTVGQTNSIKKASAKLNLDVTNVKRHIKQLEDKMGCKLIINNSKQVELTANGKVLFDGFERAYNEILLTEKKYKQGISINSGKISIRKINVIDRSFIDSKIFSFRKKYPDVSFKIVELPSEELYNALEQLSLDFVIDEKGVSDKKTVAYETKELYDEKYCICYLSSKFGNINTITDLDNQPLIVPDSLKKDRIYFNNILKEHNIKGNATIECPDYYSALDYAESGLGFALIPKRFKNDKVKDLKYFDLDWNKQIVVSYIKENLSPSPLEFLKEFNDNIKK